jgi:hypothetical protein
VRRTVNREQSPAMQRSRARRARPSIWITQDHIWRAELRDALQVTYLARLLPALWLDHRFRLQKQETRELPREFLRYYF